MRIRKVFLLLWWMRMVKPIIMTVARAMLLPLRPLLLLMMTRQDTIC